MSNRVCVPSSVCVCVCVCVCEGNISSARIITEFMSYLCSIDIVIQHLSSYCLPSYIPNLKSNIQVSQNIKKICKSKNTKKVSNNVTTKTVSQNTKLQQEPLNLICLLVCRLVQSDVWNYEVMLSEEIIVEIQVYTFIPFPQTHIYNHLQNKRK